jgi:hypothetical protein
MAEHPPSPPDRPDDPARPRKPIPSPQPAKQSGMVRRRVNLGDLSKEKREASKGSKGETVDSGTVRKRVELSPASEPPPFRPVKPRSVPAASPARQQGDSSAAPPPEVAPAQSREVEDSTTTSQTRTAESPRARRRKVEPVGEDAWTGGQIMSMWWVLAGLGCLIVVGIVFWSIGSSKPGEKVVQPTRVKITQNLDKIPIAEFVINAGEIMPKVTELLEVALSAEDASFAESIRGGEQSAERWRSWKARNPESARHHPEVRRQLHAAAASGSGYLVLVGLGADHLAAVAYFVKEGDAFKYDWEASEGYSELLPNEVEQLADAEPKLMRVVVSRSDFYTSHFPEEEYTAYSLHHQDPGKFIWAFAKRTSLANQKLIASYLARDLPGTQNRATVMVRKGPEGARANQLEIVEFLHTDWFTPEGVSEP